MADLLLITCDLAVQVHAFTNYTSGIRNLDGVLASTYHGRSIRPHLPPEELLGHSHAKCIRCLVYRLSSIDGMRSITTQTRGAVQSRVFVLLLRHSIIVYLELLS